MASNPRTSNRARRNRVAAQVFCEESTCWLCGDPVDMDLRGRYVITPAGKRCVHPLSPTVDEMLPVKFGGSPYDRANCRLAHWRCNIYRGDRLDIENVQRELREGKARATRPKVKPSPSQRW